MFLSQQPRKPRSALLFRERKVSRRLQILSIVFARFSDYGFKTGGRADEAILCTRVGSSWLSHCDSNGCSYLSSFVGKPLDSLCSMLPVEEDSMTFEVVSHPFSARVHQPYKKTQHLISGFISSQPPGLVLALPPGAYSRYIVDLEVNAKGFVWTKVLFMYFDYSAPAHCIAYTRLTGNTFRRQCSFRSWCGGWRVRVEKGVFE